MKQQPRPFVVEISQKRGLVKKPHSIWGGIDLSALRNDIVGVEERSTIADTTPQPPAGVKLVPIQSVLGIVQEASDTEDVIVGEAFIPEPVTVEEEMVLPIAGAPTTVIGPVGPDDSGKSCL